jgi:hypothetical protein
MNDDPKVMQEINEHILGILANDTFLIANMLVIHQGDESFVRLEIFSFTLNQLFGHQVVRMGVRRRLFSMASASSGMPWQVAQETLMKSNMRLYFSLRNFRFTSKEKCWSILLMTTTTGESPSKAFDVLPPVFRTSSCEAALSKVVEANPRLKSASLALRGVFVNPHGLQDPPPEIMRHGKGALRIYFGDRMEQELPLNASTDYAEIGVYG